MKTYLPLLVGAALLFLLWRFWPKPRQQDLNTLVADYEAATDEQKQALDSTLAAMLAADAAARRQ